MLGILGILVSLLLLIVLAYRGWNVLLVAPRCALVALDVVPVAMAPGIFVLATSCAYSKDLIADLQPVWEGR